MEVGRNENGKGYFRVSQGLGASADDVEMASETKEGRLKILKNWVVELETNEKPTSKELKDCAWEVYKFFTQFQSDLTEAEKGAVSSLQERLVALNEGKTIELRESTNEIDSLSRCKMACSRIWQCFSSCFAWRKS